MQIPRIKFNEVTNNRFPINQGIRNRLGIVGKFGRGPANVFQYVNGFEEFAQVYGSNTELGSMGVQAAFDQGARDFGIVRVLGKDQNAKGKLIIGGTAAEDNSLRITITGVEDVEPSVDTNFSINIVSEGSVYTGTEDGYYAFMVNEVDEDDSEVYQAIINWAFYSIDDVENPGEAVQKLRAELQAWDSNGQTETDDGIDFPEHAAGVAAGQVRGRFQIDLATEGGTAKNIPGTNGVSLTFANAPVNSIEFKYNQAFTLYVTHFESSVKINKGDQSLEVAQKFESKLQGVYPLGTISNTLEYVTAQGAPYTSTIEFELDGTDERLEGVKGNNYFYTITLANEPDSNVTDITINLPDADANSPTIAGFRGGIDGPKNAKVTLYNADSLRLIEVVAASPGEWGNELRMTINYIDGTSFRINLEDAEADQYNPPIPKESFVVNLTQAGAIDSDGQITALQDSVLARAYFLPALYNPTGYNVALLSQLPRRIAVENPTSTNLRDPSHTNYVGPRALGGAPFDEDTPPIAITFEEGTDGPALTEDDFVQAAKLFEGQQVHYIFAPGTYTNFPRLQAQLVTIAENSTEQEGLKIAILNAKPKLKPSAAFRETLAINSQRAVMLTGWATYGGQPNSPRYGLSPDSIYAGRLTRLPFYISPAARTSSGPLFNITEVDNDKYTSISSLQFYTDARLEVVFSEISLGGFFLLNGITTSSDPNWEKLVVRRTYDVIRQDLFVGLQNYKSEPHTPLLRKQIETSVNAYMNNQLRNQRIANTTGAVANNSNNPQENYINGELNVGLSFLPLYAADYINIDIKRNIEGGIQISG